ncbi:hypothetical protein MNB_SV-3-1131 [hydrothermal vent metagenome]|uniref:Uncharacterized protein n=1 Tax=hydrothermal vent metagenome TaxID=652676 RepID=A0A1W1CY70_9ZZZZ
MDIESAKNAGVHAIAVTSGYATHLVLQKCTSFVCTNVSEAIEHIKKNDENYK